MDPNQSEGTPVCDVEVVHSPKDEPDLNKLTQAERQAQFRRKRQEYVAEKQARRKQLLRMKKEEFGQSSSDSSQEEGAGSRSSGSSGVKVSEKPIPETRVQITSNRLEVQAKTTAQQVSPVKKKSETLERINVVALSKKGNDWVKDVLVIGEKTIIILNSTEDIKKFSKIKIMSEPVQGNPYKIKITCDDQQTIFGVGSNQDKHGLPLPYYTFAKLIQTKLTQSGVKLRESVQQKIAGVPENITANSLIYGKIHKKSQVLGNWEQRFIMINKEGIFSYKKFTQKHSMSIAAGSINELWTRFEVQDGLLIVKIWHAGKKTEFGFPLTDFLSTASWLYNFYCMMGRTK